MEKHMEITMYYEKLIFRNGSDNTWLSLEERPDDGWYVTVGEEKRQPPVFKNREEAVLKFQELLDQLLSTGWILQ